MTFNIPQKKTHVRKLGLDKKLLNCLINILLFTRKGAYGTSAFLCLLWLVGSYDWGFELIAVALQSWRLWSDYSLIHSFYSLTLLFFFNFIFKLYMIVLVLPNKMNPPQVYMCSPSWTLLPANSLYGKEHCQKRRGLQCNVKTQFTGSYNHFQLGCTSHGPSAQWQWKIFTGLLAVDSCIISKNTEDTGTAQLTAQL